MPIQINTYRQEWPLLFSIEKREILNAFEGLVPEIEHIGTTSVEGCSGRSEIDILIGVDKHFEIALFIDGLEAINYTIEDQKEDCIVLIKKEGSVISHKVFLMYKSSERHRSLLFFKQFLKNNDIERGMYENLKSDLAGYGWVDSQDYDEAKSKFIAFVEHREKLDVVE